MAIQVQYDFRTSQVSGFLKDVPQGMKRATSRAMNSLNRDIRDEATEGVTSVYNIRKTDAKRNIRLVRRSGPNSLFVVWKATGSPIPLKSYDPKGGLPKGRRIPVTVEVSKGRRKEVAGAFIGPNGQLFRRVGKARKPIIKLWGPSIPSGFIKDKVSNALVGLTNRLLPRRVESEMVWELRKLATGRLPKA